MQNILKDVHFQVQAKDITSLAWFKLGIWQTIGAFKHKSYKLKQKERGGLV